MSREVTRRETLLDCLAYQRKRKLMASKRQMGFEALEGLEEEFDTRGAKCRILQDMIQALESEPVRAALAEWQIRLMKGEKTNTEDLKAGA